MKKVIQLLVGLAISGTLVLGVLLFSDRIQPNVGWNTGPSTAVLVTPQLPQPNVGWNT
jgi:hypothetical protein